MMLIASAVLFGSFLLSSLYLQNVLGTGPLETGLAFLPFAAAIGAGVHAGRPRHHATGACASRSPPGSPSRPPGCCCSPASSADGSYVGDVLPGMLVAGLGLGVVLVVRLGRRADRRPGGGGRDALRA